MKITAMAVFCGSKNGKSPVYFEQAAKLGSILAKQGISLIYGGGSKGLMGAIANAMLQNKGRVIGIIPGLLVEWEHQHDGLTELTIVEDMHIRKKKIYELSDAAIILPGGFGTLDELFEILTWNQLSIHTKRVFILNTTGFYDPIIAHIKKMNEEGFLYDPWEKNIVVLNKPEDILGYLTDN